MTEQQKEALKKYGEIVAGLSALDYFPSDSNARLAIVMQVASMVHSTDEAEWLVHRTLGLYTKWVSPRELRAVFTSKFQPRDGLSAVSGEYPDGIPSERATEPWQPQIPAGATREPLQLEGPVLELAKALKIRAEPKPKVVMLDESARKEIEARVEQAKAENREKAARGELGWEGWNEKTTSDLIRAAIKGVFVEPMA